MTNAEARFNKIHIRKVYACLAVTCHLHFWQNDRDFLRATVVTRGWNGYRNKSQHRKSTLEKKILLPFQQGFEPTTFQSRVRCSNHWAIPAPPQTQARLSLTYIYNHKYDQVWYCIHSKVTLTSNSALVIISLTWLILIEHPFEIERPPHLLRRDGIQ